MVPTHPSPFDSKNHNLFLNTTSSSQSAKPPILSSFPGFLHVPYFPTTTNSNNNNSTTTTLFHEDLTIRCITPLDRSSDTIITQSHRSNSNITSSRSDAKESNESSDDESDDSENSVIESSTETSQYHNSEASISTLKTRRKRKKKKKGLYCYKSYLDCQRKEKKLRNITESEEQSLLHDLNIIFNHHPPSQVESINFPKFEKANYFSKFLSNPLSTTELARIRAKLIVRQRKMAKQTVNENNETTNFDIEHFTRNWSLSKGSNYYKTNCVNNDTIPSHLLPNSNHFSEMHDDRSTTLTSLQTPSKSKIIPKILPKPTSLKDHSKKMLPPPSIQKGGITNAASSSHTLSAQAMLNDHPSKIPSNAFPFMPIPSIFQMSPSPSPQPPQTLYHSSPPPSYFHFTSPPNYFVEYFYKKGHEMSHHQTSSEEMIMSTTLNYSSDRKDGIHTSDMSRRNVNTIVKADIDITTVADHIDHSSKDSRFTTDNSRPLGEECCKISTFREKLLGKEIDWNRRDRSITAKLKDESPCKMIRLFKELVMRIHEKFNSQKVSSLLPSLKYGPSHVYFTHIEERYVVQTNSLLSRCFWPSIDVSIYLNQPQFSIVSLYNHLVVGFGTICPQTGYIHYLVTHPHWRNCGIGAFMISYLIAQYSKKSFEIVESTKRMSCPNEITIHVPTTDIRTISFLKKLKFTVRTVHEGFFSQLVTTPSGENEKYSTSTTNILDFLKHKSFDALLMSRPFQVVINK
ncbi:hypothetical protein FDP41_000546 [Naegleria fowleri]|uniref:N-acetyltransferase domain-containing protein n=1 Tax=Naegleria fowleri TaxID=5763 RepID=A0A6A5C5T5_NAEFO|nr:uncharacterized protein FDP41_000546 [Naegleria fowleri]KAF0984647.1 hypothetical protein FDP41_000546 [Naegleria fowleri]